jgi:peptide/nickel transport system ATP-binding protein
MSATVADTIAAAPTGQDLPAELVLRVTGLKKTFGDPGRGGRGGAVRAVDDVSFEVRRGHTLALVGESGCGKTTTARCVLKAIQPTAGTVAYRTAAGETVDLATLPAKRLRPLRAELQMVFQDPYASLNPRLNVRDIIAEPLVVHGWRDRAKIEARVGELLELVGLRRDHMSRFPNAFSGGQRQRIGIARALALNPRLIVADEAVSALDVSVQAQILNLLLDLQDELGLSYLFVSHDLSVVKHVADEVGVMYVGQMVELGPCEALFERPLHPYTATLLAAAPKPDPALRGGERPAPGEVASARNPPSGCYFHPRCPFALEVCKATAPVWRELVPGRFARCHRAEELELTGVVA